MKRILFTLVSLLMFYPVFAQSSRGVEYVADKDTISSADIAIKRILENTYEQIGVLDALERRLIRLERVSAPHYKLYPTENNWTFLELDTSFGVVYHVQWSLKDNDGRYTIGYANNVDEPSENYYPGRFELYPTSNMFNFLLLDGRTGQVFQVQWNTEREKEGIWEIKEL